MNGQPMIAAKATRAKARTRNRLMASGAMGMAIGALMLAPQMARAQVTVPGGQAFQGNAQVVAGGATVVQSATQDTITVTTPQAVINWTPNDRTGTGTIDFLPEGLRGLFTGDADFTVLNRIIPVDGNDIPVARMIALNGLIDSQVNGQQGGSIWFYSPGGILVGGTSVINVGSLLLTSRDIDTSGGLFGPDQTIRFRNPTIAGANGRIEIDVLARINARNSVPGSAYVAMVAPRVVQAGTVRSDGAIALVAAEEVDIRINRGLFDIVVTTGTSDPNGIVHTGSSTGPSDTSTQFENRAYLVAVPKNQAMTMLLSGTIGFETASSVSIASNGGILLSAGANVLQGALVPPTGNTGTANISITDSRFANNLGAIASGTIVARPSQSCAPLCSATNPAGQLLFGGSATFAASNGVSISVGQAQRMTVAGNLLILSARPGQGGNASLTIDNAAPPTTSTSGGGVIQVAGLILLDASAGGSPVTGTATGGTASVSVNNGQLTAAAISVLANGAARLDSTGAGADGQGGTASANVTNGGLLSTGTLAVSANGRGSGAGRDAQSNPFLATNGGDGTGGTATVVVSGLSTLNTSQGLQVTADGDGAGGSVSSGVGTGGTASASIDSSVFASGLTRISAVGRGGGSGFDSATSTFFSTNVGGDAQGGTASFSVSNTSTSDVVVSALRVDAGALGGVGSNSSNPPLSSSGGDAVGGNARFTMAGATSVAQIDDMVVSASATGGSGLGDPGVGGNGTGGTTTFTFASGSNLTSNQQIVGQADGSGGIGTTTSGNGAGGSVDVSLASGALVDGDRIRFSASGLGGGTVNPQQSFAPNTNIGGDGGGGLITVFSSGSLSGTSLTLEANGSGGDSNPTSTAIGGLSGGDGQGGSVSLQQLAGSIAVGTFVSRTNGTGGSSGSFTGTTGTGTGGSNSIRLNGGSFSASSSFGIEALGFANLSDLGTVGAITGGSADLVVANSAVLTVDGTLSLLATADGGANSQVFASTGNAQGGNATLTASGGGSITAGSLIVNTLGRSTGSLETTGSATGGIVAILAESGGSITATTSSSIGASGLGGNGVTAGSGRGGSVGLTADGGAISLLGDSNISVGGQSGFAFGEDLSPAAQGGALSIRLTDNIDSAVTFGNLTIGVDGDFASNISSARSGGGGFNSGNAPGDPGNADGGTIDILIEGGTMTGSSLFGSASGYATQGGTGTGGRLNLTMTGGTVAVDFFQFLLTGAGGTSLVDFDEGGDRPVSGSGFGGTATVNLTGGTLSGSFLSIQADGVGGLGVLGTHQSFNDGEGGIFTETTYSGDGGDGTGGSIDVLIDGTVTINTAEISFAAQGRGGNGGGFTTISGDEGYTSGSGGNGTGGAVDIDLLGGTVNAANVAAFAGARGGDGGRVFDFNDGTVSLSNGPPDSDPIGGNAVGGTARITLTDTVTAAGLTIDASGSGGEGGSILRGYAGGNGTGGLAEAIVQGIGAASIEIEISSNGAGGRGGRAIHGDGGDGGIGTGGTARFAVTSGGKFDLNPNSSVIAQGLGGEGRSGNDGSLFGGYVAGETGFDGGDGGDGFGGTIEIAAIDSDVVLALSGGEGFELSNTGLGGLGGNGADNNSGSSDIPTFGGNGGDGGDGYGGTARLTASGGTLSNQIGDTLSIAAIGERGQGGLGGQGVVTSVTDPETEETTFFGGNGTDGFSGLTFGGTVRLGASDTESGTGLIALTSLFADVSGDVGGRVELIDDSSGPGIALGSFDMVNGTSGFSFCGALPLCGSGLYVSSRDGAITIAGDVDLDLVGGFQVDAFGTGGLVVGGNLSVIVGLDIIARHEGREDSATIEANDIVFGGGPIDLQTGTLIRSTSGSIDLTSGSFVNFDEIDSASDVFMDAGTSITGSELVSGSAVTALADGTIDIDSVAAGNDANLVAGGTLRVGDLTTTNGSAALTGNGVTLDNGTIATSLTVRAQNGDAVIGTVTAGAFADIDSVEDVTITSLTTTGLGTGGGSSAPTASIIVNSGGVITLGSLNSAENVAITADTLVQPTGNGESAPTGNSSIIAVGAISIGTAQDIDFGSADGASITLFTTGGDIRFGSTTSDIDTSMTATVGSITGTSVTTDDGNATLTADRSITLDNANIGDVLRLTAGGDVALGTSVSGYDTLITSGGDVSVVSVTTTDIGSTAPISTANIVISAASGTVSLGTLASAENISIAADTIGNANSSLTAAGGVSLTSDNNSDVGSVIANSLTIDSGRSASVQSAELVGGMTADVTNTLTIGDVNAGGDIALSANDAIAIGTLTAGGALDATVTTGGFRLAQGGSGDATINARGLIDIDTLTAGGTLSITGGGNAILDDVSGFDTIIGVAGALSFTTLDASETLRVEAGRIDGLGSTVTAGISADLTTTSGAMILGRVEAPATTLTSADGIAFNVIRAGTATLQAQQDIEASSSFGATIIVGDSASLNSAEGGISIGSIDANNDISLVAATDITAGTLTALDGDVFADAGGTLTLRSVGAGNNLTTSSGGNTEIDIATVNGIATIGSLGDIDIERLVTTGGSGGGQGGLAPINGDMVITAAGNVTLGELDSANDIVIDAAALFGNASTITAVGDVSLLLDTSASFGTLDAGSLIATAGTSIDFTRVTTIGSSSLSAGTGVTGDTLTSTNGGVSVTSNGGVIDIGTARALFDLAISNSGGGVTLGSATSTQSGIFIDASGAVEILTASSAGQFDVASDADIVIGTATSFGDTILDAGTTITVTSLTTTGQTSSNSSAPTNAMIRLTAGGDVTIGTLDSIGDVTIDGDKLLSSIGGGAAPAGSSILAGGDIVIDTTQAVQFGLADADGNVTITAGDALGFTTITAGDSVAITAGTVIAPTSLIEAGVNVSVATSGNAGLGDIDGASILIDSGDGIDFSTITASDGASLFAEQDILGGSIAVSNGSLAVTSAEGGIAILTASAAENASFSAFTDVTLGSLTVTDGSASVDAGGDITIDLGDVAGAFASDSGGNTLIGTLTSGGASAITADGNVGIVSLTTGVSGGGQGGLIVLPGDIAITALGTVTLGELDAANNIVIDAAALIGDSSSITAVGDVSLIIDTSASFGTLDAGSLIGTAGTSIDFTRATTIGTNSLGAGTGITGETQTSSGGSVFAFTNNGLIAIDSITAGVDATVTNFGGGITLGSVTTQSGDILVDAAGDVTLFNAVSAGQFEIDAEGAVFVLSGTSVGDALIDAGTTITVNSLITTGQTSNNSSAPTNAMIRLTANGIAQIAALRSIGDVQIDSAALFTVPTGGSAPVPLRSSIVAGDNISIVTDGDANFGSADAGGDVTISAPGTLNFASIAADGSAFITAGLIDAASSTVDADLNIFIDNDAESALGTLNGGFVSVTSDVGIDFDSITGTDGASLFAQRDIVGGTISTPGGTLSVTSAEGGIAITTANSGSDARFSSAGDTTLGSLTVTGGSAFINAGGDIRVDLGIIADAFVSTSDGNTTIGTLTSGGTSSIEADGDILITQLTTTGLGGSQNSSAPAGANILLTADGSIALGSIDSAERISISASSLTGAESSIDAAGMISIDTVGAAQFGALNGDESAAITTGSTLTFGSSTTIGSTSIEAGGAVSGGALRSEFGALQVTTTDGSVTLASAYAGRAVDFDIDDDLTIAGALTVAAPQSEQVNSALIVTGGDVSIDSGSIGGALTITSGGDVALANSFTVAGDAIVAADGEIAVAGFTATQSTATSSTPSLAGNIRLDAGSTLTLNGNVAAAGNVVANADDVQAANRLISAGGNITVFGDDDVVLGSLDGGFVSIRSNETIDFTSVLARNGTNIFAEQDVTGGSIDTGGNLSVTSAEGGIALTSAAADIDASFSAGTDIAIGQLLTDFGAATANAEGDIRIDSGSVGGSFTAVSGEDTVIGDLTSAGPASIEADNDIIITRLTTTGIGGSQNSSAPVAASISLNADGNVTLGTLDSAAGIVIDAGNLFQSGGGGETPASDISARDGVIISVSGSASFGSLTASFADIDTGGSLDFGSSATSSSTQITSGGDVTGGSLTSDFSSLDVLSSGGTISIGSANAGGNATFAAGEGDIDIGSLGAEGNISLTALQGQVSGGFAETQFGTIVIDAATVDYGELQSAGTILVRASGDVAIDFAQTNGEGGSGGEDRNALPGFVGGTDAVAPPTGSDIIIAAGGNLTAGEFISAEDIIIDAASLIGANSSMTAEGIIDIDVTGNAEFGSLTASGNQILVEADGAITGTMVNAKAAESATRITGTNGVTIATIRAPGTLEVRAPQGGIVVSDLQAGSAIVSGQTADVTATAATLFTLAQATGGALSVRGTNGTLTLSDARASGALTARSSNGALVIGTAQAGSIDLQSDTTATLNGAVTATGALTADVRGMATVNGVATGATIAIASGDIAIGPTARIGTAGTTTELRLTNSSNDRQTFIGGADTTAGYSLSATELSRLFSGNITVRGSNFDSRGGMVASAPGTATIAPSGNPNVVIDSFTLTGGATSGGNLGSGGTFRIEAPGFARVIGTATLNNLTADNRFVISAERAVQVIMGQGAIRLNGANGLAGTLLFDADDVVVATASAIADIAALTDSAAIDERLAQNDGILSDEGALSAGTIAFAVSSGVYVQNSGDGDDFDDRRGFTAGAGGVDITTRQSTSTQGSPRIVINGRIDAGAGEFLTGVDAFGRVTIDDVTLTGENQLVSGIDPGSTLNGCLIASASNCFALEVDVIPPVQDNPLVDEDDEESDESEGEDSLSVTTVIEIKDVLPLPNEPLIDDPVTGSPNDDLWVPTEG